MPSKISSLKSTAIDLFRTTVEHVFPGRVDEALIARLVEGTGFPPSVKLGHVAVPCHPLSKGLKKSPIAIAQELATAAIPFFPVQVARVQAAQGYFNVFFKNEVVAPFVFQGAQSGHLLQEKPLPSDQREKIILEYSQPNTHKIIHVGHLRNTVYGDAVAELLAHAGHDVIRATYPGDMGAHIAKCLWFVSRFKRQEIPTQHRSDWLGRCYAEADQHLTKIEGTPEGESAKAEIAETLQQLEHQSGDIYPFYLETRQWSLDHMKEIYAWLGVHFDRWYYESECDGPSRELVQQKYREGVFQLSEGAIGLDLSAFDLGFAMVLRSDGTGLYLTKDLELIKQKFSDPTVTQSIYVVDSRQQHHFKQLFKVAEILGYPQAARSVHLSYDSVVDADGKAFSSRALGCATLDELRVLLRQRVMTDYLESHRGDWPDAEIEATADQIVVGALKYGFLKIDPQRIIRFLLDDWIKVEGDTGPYLQYTLARARNILRKAGVLDAGKRDFVPAFETELEEEMFYYSLRLDAVALRAAREYRPNIVCEYLFELSKLFNRFYKECPVTKAPTPELQASRLCLVEIVAAHLGAGMRLVTLPTPDRL